MMSEPAAARSPYKALLFSLLGLVVFVVLLWFGAMLYWQLRIAAAIHQWENSVIVRPHDPNISGLNRENADLLFHAGCRALPALVAAINASGNAHFQQEAMDHVLSTLAGHSPLSEAGLREFEERSARFNLYAEGLEFERKEHLADFNAWWAENASRYHQPWRVWSDQCHE